MADRVEVEVLKVERGGVRVKLMKDGRAGFIRRRELSWDRSVRTTTPGPKAGDRFDAIVLRDREAYVELSVRQLTDPWAARHGKYKSDEVVRGEVTHIRQFGAFVQIEPGIDAIIRPHGIPLLPDQLPDSVLSVGDRIEGVITHIDRKRRHVEISLTGRLRQLSRLPAKERLAIQLDLFKGELAASKGMPGAENALSILGDSQVVIRQYHRPIARPKMLLVIDDDKEDCQGICQHLKEALGVEADGVYSRQEALDKIRKQPAYGLIVIDVRLSRENGVRVAEELLELRPDLVIVFTSIAQLTPDEIIEMSELGSPFVHKDPEAIVELIDDLCNGYWEDRRDSAALGYVGSGSYVEQLGMMALAQRSLPEALQPMLEKVRKQTHASHAMVFQVNSLNKTVSVVAVDPPLDDSIKRQILDGLYYSPVQNVVEETNQFYKTGIAQTKRPYPRFKSFFHVLPFRSCLGLPLTIPDLDTSHALFLFDEDRSEFEPEDLDDARRAARLFEVALERAMLLDYMRRYEQRYSLGQLLSSLIHELSNKMDGLDGIVQSLPRALENIAASTEPAQRLASLEEAETAAQELTELSQRLRELVHAYSRMVSGDLEAVDINDAVRKVKLQLDAKARENGIGEIVLQEEPGLPPARAISSRLEQIAMNLVLNSILQIGRHRDAMARIARRAGDPSPLSQEGHILVQTRYVRGHVPRPIQIIVIDTGPGIHYYQQERLFVLDVSTRPKGHGLGLFISQNLARTLGGRVRLVDSVMLMGTAFMVELPVFREGER
jgi:signal transduction histidine kinase/CheY-like chemotaxis protein/predicted RNA-binding protein with RPS1 domain